MENRGETTWGETTRGETSWGETSCDRRGEHNIGWNYLIYTELVAKRLGIRKSSHQTSWPKTGKMASLKDIVIMYQSLKREWDKKPQNLDRCGELLTKLKVIKAMC